MLWDDAMVHENGNVVEVPLEYNFHAVPVDKGRTIENIGEKQKESFFRMILKSDRNGGFRTYILKFYPNNSTTNQNQISLNNYSDISSDFSGKIELTGWDEKLMKAWKVSNGKVVTYITPSEFTGKNRSNGENLSQSGCSYYTESYCFMYEDKNGTVIECQESTPVVECDQDSSYDEGIDGGSNWDQNDWHGFWPGFGSGTSNNYYNSTAYWNGVYATLTEYVFQENPGVKNYGSLNPSQRLLHILNHLEVAKQNNTNVKIMDIFTNLPNYGS